MEIAKRGRPRSFDTNEALDSAMRVFWRHGYEGATVARLQESTGLTPPSLYSAFGSKEDLYRRCLDRYAEVHGFALDETVDARSAIRRFLHRAAGVFADPSHPPGCMISAASLTMKQELTAARREAAERRAATLRLVTGRLERARSDGELPHDADPETLARFVGAIVQGMSVQAIDGADEATLQAIADVAMHAWPT